MRTLSRTDASSSSDLTMRAWSKATSHGTSSAASCSDAEVAHGHHVVEPVDADALAADLVGDPVARPVDEHLLVDPRRPVLAHVAGLRREHDRRVAVDGQQDVRVAVDDHEAAEIGDGPLEARVLVAAHEDGVEAVALGGLADEPVPALDLLGRQAVVGRLAGSSYCCQDCSTPFTRAQIAAFSGVGTPCSRPNLTIPPFR